MSISAAALAMTMARSAAWRAGSAAASASAAAAPTAQPGAAPPAAPAAPINAAAHHRDLRGLDGALRDAAARRRSSSCETGAGGDRARSGQRRSPRSRSAAPAPRIRCEMVFQLPVNVWIPAGVTLRLRRQGAPLAAALATGARRPAASPISTLTNDQVEADARRPRRKAASRSRMRRGATSTFRCRSRGSAGVRRAAPSNSRQQRLPCRGTWRAWPDSLRGFTSNTDLGLPSCSAICEHAALRPRLAKHLLALCGQATRCWGFAPMALAMAINDSTQAQGSRYGSPTACQRSPTLSRRRYATGIQRASTSISPSTPVMTLRSC